MGQTLAWAPVPRNGAPKLAALALDWLQTDPTARLIVDSNRFVLWRNAAADALLRECPDLDARNGQLSADDRHGAALLAQQVSAAGADMTTLTIPCRDGDGHVLFQIRRLPGLDQDAPVALVLHRTGSANRVRYADFSDAFGLTAAEYRVVLHLIDGHNAEAIAGSNGGAVGTVRSHIRSVYAKLDVSSREGLFFRLSPFRVL